MQHQRCAALQDLARLSRWMAGKAVGLVLSGGGSRGLAHLGVLHALDDAGIPVDVIGGTSQGAYMAALYAQVGHSCHAWLCRLAAVLPSCVSVQASHSGCHTPPSHQWRFPGRPHGSPVRPGAALPSFVIMTVN